ncbi:MAG: sensor histidine kinase N-terminal domain-containing protein [Thiothrix sp.]|nr:sensor histidine kinase N-terminal domain-containing protein [Thiothrix sp.]HPQ97201.1 ATP-binding protein [Thiolinea sp.]
MNSLRTRLLTLVLGLVAVVWAGAAFLTWQDARRELDTLLDAHLAQAATLLVAQFSHELDELELEYGHPPNKYEHRVAFQVWGRDGRRLLFRSVNAPRTPLGSAHTGFNTVRVDGADWRVFSTHASSEDGEDDERLLIHVAEPLNVRTGLAASISTNLLYPLWLTLPLLGLLLWWAVSVSLRPLTVLARAVSQRRPDNLSPLPAQQLAELAPLTQRLNQLFARIERLIDNERRFTADAAHELRTPIAAIQAQLQVAQGAAGSLQRNHALQQALDGCRRATHLIGQLLTLARLESQSGMALERCDLTILAAGVVAECAPDALQQGVELALVADGPFLLEGWPVLLQVLVRNLLDNALRHAEGASLVEVCISPDQGQGGMLSVCDNGRGVVAAEREKLGQRFYRPADTRSDGSGLGLSIVQRIAERHQAALTLESGTGGTGLCVVLRFAGCPLPESVPKCGV